MKNIEICENDAKYINTKDIKNLYENVNKKAKKLNSCCYLPYNIINILKSNTNNPDIKFILENIDINSFEAKIIDFEEKVIKNKDNVEYNSSYYDIINNSLLSIYYFIQKVKCYIEKIKCEDAIYKFILINKYYDILIKNNEVYKPEISDNIGFLAKYQHLFNITIKKSDNVFDEKIVIFPCGSNKIEYIDLILKLKNNEVQSINKQKFNLLNFRKLLNTFPDIKLI